MKKFIFVIILILCLAISGCCKQPSSENTDISESTSAESSTEIPNAKEFPEIAWPTFGIATKIPTPDWSNHGEILADSEVLFWSQIGYSTLDNFNNYVKACQDAGYTEDYYSMPSYFYYGADSEGRAIQLTYNQLDHYIAIQVTIDASEWSKWWVKE